MEQPNDPPASTMISGKDRLFLKEQENIRRMQEAVRQVQGQVFKTQKYKGVTWTRNAGPKGGAQAKVFSELQPRQFPIALHTRKEGRLWAAVTYERLKELIKEDGGYYEILKADHKRKVHFDIELEGHDKEDPLETCQDLLRETFPGCRMHTCGDKVLPGDKHPKWSYHIVLSNYHADNLDEMAGVQQFCAEHTDMGFDKAVYTRNRNMKCINQTKYDPRKPDRIRRPQLRIDGSEDLTKHLILHDFDEDSVNVTTVLPPPPADSAVTRGGRRIKIDILNIPQMDLVIPDDDFEMEQAYPLDKLRILPNYPKGHPQNLGHQRTWEIMVWAQGCDITFEDFWGWCRQSDDSPERLDKYQRAWSDVKEYRISSATIDAILLRFYPRLREETLASKMRRAFELPAGTVVVPGAFVRQENIDITCKYTTLAGPMGGNKTGAAADFIAKWIQDHPDARILWIAPRRTLSKNTVPRLAQCGLDFAVYLDFSGATKGRLEQSKYVICSIQSLSRLWRSYDVVVMDEFETVLNTFSGDCKTHRDLRSSWNTFMKVMRDAKKVIAMDAFTTRLTTHFFEQCIQKHGTEGERYEVVKTAAPPKRRQFWECKDDKTWLHKAREDLRQGKKIYIYTAYLKGETGVAGICKAFCAEFGWTEGEQILSYCGADEEAKGRLIDCEGLWANPKVRCIVTNGAISVGVNFNIPKVFDCIYALHAPHISARDFMQALYRVRHPKSAIMHLFRVKFGKFSKGWENPPWRPSGDRVFDQMRKDLQLEAFANNKKETFGLFQEKSGIVTKPKKARTKKANREDIKALLKMADVTFKWDRVQDITEEEAEEFMLLTASNQSNLQQKLMVDKYYLRKKFVPDAPEASIKELWKKWPDLPGLVDRVLKRKHDIVRRVLDENGCEVGQELPKRAKISIPLEQIKRAFTFHNAPKDHRPHLVSRVLNTYFGKNVYWRAEERETIDGKQVYPYETSDDYLELASFCRDYMVSNQETPMDDESGEEEGGV